MWRVLAFLAWPLIEIALFVLIGGQIGLWFTLAWVLGTAVLGVFLLRAEAQRGAAVLRGGLAGGMQGGAMPQGAALAGLFRALAAVLLILPGFLTDAFGILLLLPPVQAVLANTLAARVQAARGGMSMGMGGGFGASQPGAQDDVIDGEWVEVPTEANRNRRPSGWTEAQIEAQLVDDDPSEPGRKR